MSRLTSSFLLIAGLLLGTNTLLAASYAVGTCKPSLPSYTSISAAVSNVPPGSTVLVCPGTYAEQITITQPLTLQGIASGNAGQVVIAVPSSGLTTITDPVNLATIAAQVAVMTGPVTISDITVDKTGNNIDCYYVGGVLVGIFYGDGSSGTVNGATLRQQITTWGTGVGVWFGSGSVTSLTVQNSSFHDIDSTAVMALGFGSATVKGNSMEASSVQVELSAEGYAVGSITGNTINGGQYGVIATSLGTVAGNTITNSSVAGIETFGFGSNGLSVTSNKISNVPTGIYINESGDTYKSNTITKVGIGIEFNCNSPIVASNTINDATTGIDQVPAGFTASNTFTSVATIRTGCASAANTGQGLRAPHFGPTSVYAD